MRFKEVENVSRRLRPKKRLSMTAGQGEKEAASKKKTREKKPKGRSVAIAHHQRPAGRAAPYSSPSEKT